ncbi:MAG TPA: hypothetical protein VF599_15000 [Pyrinomonadaceae bacterium]|jgi:hypothetical protein
MEVYVQMSVSEETDSGRLPTFWLLGFYPGAIQKKTKNGDYWVEWIDDKSVLPIAHLMERAFKLNQLVIFKKPDGVTQKLLRAHQRKTRLDAKISVAIKTESGGGHLWQGGYEFRFLVEQMLANQSDAEGNQWEQLQLKIIDKTENIAMPE